MNSACLKICLLLSGILFSVFTWAQPKRITGKVSAAADGAAMVGVSVTVKGKSAGTQTNENGEYAIDAAAADVLVFSYTGYVAEERPVGNLGVIDIALHTEAGNLDEVGVIGYGTQKRSKLTNSVSKLDNKVLETGMRSNPASALAGTVPGLRVQQTSGRPGSVPTVILRGGTNFNGTGGPLIVVDGLLRGGFSDMNQDDIESIEVLKDASATAIYGARASNGVVLITTKKGKAGSSRISLNARYGMNYLNLPFEFLGARDYLTYARTSVQVSGQYDPSRLSQLTTAGPFGTGNLYLDGAGNVIDGNQNASGVWSTMRLNNTNRHKLNEGWQWMIDPVNGTDTLIFTEFNYRDYALRSHSATQDINLSMTGGNDKGKYYAGFGSYNEDGLPVNTFYKRLTFVLNGEYKLKPWLTSYSGLNYANARWRDPATNNEGNYLSRSLGAPPTMRGYNENGELLLGRDVSDGNPLVNDEKFIRKNSSDKFTMSQALKIDFMKNLYLKTSANVYYSESYIESFNRDYLQSPGNRNTTRSSSASFSRDISQTYNAVLNYSGQVADKHHYELMAGSEYYDIYRQGLSASGSGAPTDDFSDLALTSTDAQRRSTDTYHDRQRILSFFGRANYDYKDRYLLSVTFRRDGYSTLINNRWGNFLGFSGGWIVSRENFFEPLSNIFSYLKLRASYGENGNVSGISSYGLQGSYGTTRYNGSVGYQLSGLPFPNLLWERSNTREIALEGTIKNKVDFQLAYYNRKTTDKISSFTLPSSNGFTSLTTNLGSMQNQGVELDVNYRVLRTKDVQVDFNFNLAYNANKVLKLPHNGLENNRIGGTQVYDPKTGRVIWVMGTQQGQDPNVAYAYVAEDLYRTQADLDKYAANLRDLNGARVLVGPAIYAGMTPAQRNGVFPIALGDVRWKDLDGNDTIDYRDRVYMGRTVPRYTGGFGLRGSWKGFTLSARFDYALGFVAYDGPRAWFMGMAQGTFNTITDVFDTYSSTNTGAKYPTFYWADQLFKNNVLRESSMFYKKGDYLAFRDLTLSYALPLKWAGKIRSEGISLSVTAQNLAYFSKATLYSPESGSIPNTAAGSGGYPLPRIIIFGAQLHF
ncbi:MAG TPA: SusC/RagA family TonB-linked outer membrane protein [Chitinophagaceae bacterium]|nr:SusC/RagA family TonB-linked outer membrane protein [Chitinophagaceae bacterium]